MGNEFHRWPDRVHENSIETSVSALGEKTGLYATGETDWKEGSPIIWRDLRNNIGANGIVEVHQPEEYLQLHYYDDIATKPQAIPGGYYEKYRVVSDKEAYILSIEIGKIEQHDIPYHLRMWDNAINIIKELAEQK